MRPFLQTKAGVSFYSNSWMTMAVRKDYFEYVFNAGHGQFGVIYLMIDRDKLSFFADTATFFKRIDSINPRCLALNKEETPLLIDLMEGKNVEFYIGSISKKNSLAELARGVMHTFSYAVTGELPVATAAKPEIISRAISLFLFTMKIYNEVKSSNNKILMDLFPYFLK